MMRVTDKDGRQGGMETDSRCSVDNRRVGKVEETDGGIRWTTDNDGRRTRI